MEKVTAEIVLAQGEPFRVTNTFKGILKSLLPDGRNVMAVVLPESGQKFYFLELAVERYLEGWYTFEEFHKATWCDGLYRNRHHLFTDDGREVEAGSLWLQRGDQLIIIDGDEDIRGPLNTQEQLFDKIV